LGAVWLLSLVKSGSIPKGTEVILLTCPTYAPLSEANRKILAGIFPAIKFHETETGYLDADLTKRWKDGEMFNPDLDENIPSKRSVYLKLSVLNLDYDTLLWLDSDMLILRSIMGLFRLPANLAMVDAGPSNHHHGVDFLPGGKLFNSGLMLIRRPYASKEWFEKSVCLLNEKKHTSMQDQSLLNELFKSENRLTLPHVYNWKLNRQPSVVLAKSVMDSARVVHWIGRSKFELVTPPANPLAETWQEMLTETGVPLTITP